MTAEDQAADGPTDPPTTEETPAKGPPGASVFSLEGRPGAGLYLVGWLLCGAAAALVFAGFIMPSGPLLIVGVIAGLIGLPTAAGYQIVARSSRPETAYRGPSPLILFLLVILVVNVFGLIVAGVTGIGGLDVDRPDVFLVGLLIQVVGYFAIVWLFVLAPRALTWRDIVRRSGDVASAIGNAMLVMLPVTVVALIMGSLAALLLGATPPQVVPIPQTPVDIALDGLAAVVLAPLGEELFFRGFALTAWLRDLGARSALIRSAFFFALVHILNVRVDNGGFDAGLRSAAVLLVVLLPIGFVLGAIYLRRGLVGSVTAHMTYNGIVFGLLLLSAYLPPPPG